MAVTKVSMKVELWAVSMAAMLVVLSAVVMVGW
jgi:hypothetical protein